MRIAFFTNEYPPHIYGGAGVHVEYLARELARLDGGTHEVDVYCFGEQNEQQGNLRVHGIAPTLKLPAGDERHAKLLDAFVRDLAMAGAVRAPDVIHGHTWYSHLGGMIARQLTGAPLVLTTHSLEPHRPWKAEQLGTAYQATSWIEQTAYQNADGVIAVSGAMSQDVQSLYSVPANRVRVIHNGIDPEEFQPRSNPAAMHMLGIDLHKPIVLFVGRITRQKGIFHLVRAIQHLEAGMQVVLCAGSPDTPAIAEEMAVLVAQAKERANVDVVWVRDMVPKKELIALYTHAAVFVCPSVYEPFGIINLESMACETPVVASAVGGIPEIITHGETGLLVPFEAEGYGSAEPKRPDEFSRDLAAAINSLMKSQGKRDEMGKAARARVLAHFSWQAIAKQTLGFYQELVARQPST